LKVDESPLYVGKGYFEVLAIGGITCCPGDVMVVDAGVGIVADAVVVEVV
jgi:hypothetical protein